MSHASHVRAVDTHLVTQLLIKKGIVSDDYNASLLYRAEQAEDDHSHTGNAADMKCKTISYEEFMSIFSRRMFRDALLRVTDRIDKVASVTNKGREGTSADAQSLVLKIYAFQRRQLMDYMNPRGEKYRHGQRVMSSLNQMKEEEAYRQAKAGDEEDSNRKRRRRYVDSDGESRTESSEEEQPPHVEKLLRGQDVDESTAMKGR